MTLSSRTPVWLWPHVLSLDGPLVALIWQDFLSRCYPAVLPRSTRWALGLTVWAIYLMDRLLDVRGPQQADETSCHRFYRAHRLTVLAAVSVILIADLSVALTFVSSTLFTAGAVVGLAAILYLGVFTGDTVHSLFWKKLLGASLFTTGVFLAASRPLPAPAVAYGLALMSNSVLIECWDRNWPTASAWIPLLLFAILSAALGRSPWFYAVALSATGLAALTLFGRRLSADARRVLADIMLASPLLLR